MRSNRNSAVAHDGFHLAWQQLFDVIGDKGCKTSGYLDARTEGCPHVHLHDAGLDLGEELRTAEVKEHKGTHR